MKADRTRFTAEKRCDANYSAPFYIDDAEADHRQAIALLRRHEPYMVHLGNCKWPHGGDRCTCGLVKLLREDKAYLEGGDEG